MPGKHAKKGYKAGGKVKAGAGGGAGRLQKAAMARKGPKAPVKGASK